MHGTALRFTDAVNGRADQAIEVATGAEHERVGEGIVQLYKMALDIGATHEGA